MIVVAAGSGAAVLVQSGFVAMLQTLPWLALFAPLCWAIFWRPKVVVSDAGVRLVNVARTVDVPWPALVEVQTKFALTLVTAYGSFTAWAAPAPSGHSTVHTVIGSSTAGRASRPRFDREALPMSERPDSPSGDAAAMVRRRWDQLREAGFLDDPRLEHAEIPVTWHVCTLVVFTLLATAGAATVAIA